MLNPLFSCPASFFYTLITIDSCCAFILYSMLFDLFVFIVVLASNLYSNFNVLLCYRFFLSSHGAECTTICIKDAQQLGWPLPSSSSLLWALVAFQLITSIHLVQCFWPGQQRNAHNVHLMPDSWKNSWLPSRPGPADSGKFTRDTTVQVFKGVCWRDEWLVEAIGNDWKWFTERVGRMLQSRMLSHYFAVKT